jgi:hypothetical protein
MGRANTKTTQIYVHYARSEHEIRLIDYAFASDSEQTPAADSQTIRSDSPPDLTRHQGPAGTHSYRLNAARDQHREITEAAQEVFLSYSIRCANASH